MTTVSQLHNEITELRGEVRQLRAEMQYGGSGVYQLSEYEQKEVREGFAEARAGKFVSDEDVNAMLYKHGLL